MRCKDSRWKRRRLSEQPTKLLAAQLVQQLVQQPVQLQQHVPRARIPRRYILFRLALSFLLLSVGFGVLLVASGKLSFFIPASNPQTSSVQSQEHQEQIIEVHSSVIEDVVHSFMGDMMKKKWTAMWAFLSPDAQQIWQGEGDFLHFEQSKFGSIRFIRYSESTADIERAWRDPDTMQVYPDATILNVSLAAGAPEKLLSAPSLQALQHGLFEHTLFALTENHGLWQVQIAGPADLEAPVLVPNSPPARKLVVPIFMYHHVSNKPTRNLLDYNLTVATTDFERQLSWLQQHGYQSISETDLFNAFYYGKALPVHPMMLTFDDGYEDMYTDALPALLAHHYRGAFYIITGMIDGNYMTWEQIHTLARDGMQIASHTVHHVNIGNPPASTSIQAELQLSMQTLEKQLDQPIQFFCYPVGEPFHNDTIFQQQVVLADLFKDGYIGATLDPFSLDSAVQNAQLPYELNRIRVSGGESLETFAGILNAVLERANVL